MNVIRHHNKCIEEDRWKASGQAIPGIANNVASVPGLKPVIVDKSEITSPSANDHGEGISSRLGVVIASQTQ